jgi:chemotaxis protein MotB
MLKKVVLAALVAALAIGLSACSVMQSTHQLKVDEADSLAKRLAALQKKHDDLSTENTALKVRNERLISDLAGLTLQKDKLTTDLAYVTGQRDKISADKEELEKLLQAKSDTLSQSIFELRRKVTDLEADNGKLKKENAGLQKALDEKSKRVADLEREAEGLRKAKEEVQKASSTYENLMEKMKKEISEGQVTISELKGKLSVNMVDSILFDSGKAEVKEGGLAILDKVISILADVKDKSIRIEGHTDNVQIRGDLAKRYPTNWELSAARAINVTRFLQKQGLDPAQLSAVGYGEYKPVGDNATPEGRAKNRRIEINLVPRE